MSYYLHIEHLTSNDALPAPTGSSADLEKKLKEIAAKLPNLFATSGDISTNIDKAELNNVGNAATNLITVTGERDKALEEAKKLEAWKDNEAFLLNLLEERKKELEKLKTSDKQNANKYKKEVEKIDKLIGEVTGLTGEKKKFEKEIDDLLAKYSSSGAKPLFSSSFNASTVADTISGGDGTNGHHWGGNNRKGVSGHSWRDYLGAATKLGTDTATEYALDDIKNNIKMGILEAIFPEILRQFHEKHITKKDVEDFMKDNPYPGFWDNTGSNPKSLKEIENIDTKYSTKYEKMTMKAIVGALKKPIKTITNWSDVLTEIGNFFTNKKPTTLKQIEEFLEDENYPDPLAGVDLNGKSDADLKKAFASKEDTTVNGELPKAADYASKYKGYTALQSSKDGNCFLNSFSILLNGDESLVTRLRAKLCLELMSGKWVDGSDANKVKEITEKLTNRTVDNVSCALAKPGDWLAGDDIAYMVGILDRPITLVYRPDTSAWDKSKDAYKEVDKTGGFALVEYPAAGKNPFKAPTITGMKKPSNAPEWSIYHVNKNHFVPLIKK